MTLERLRDMLGVIRYFFANRADFDLHRCEPQRKCARVMLDQDAEEALNRPEQCAVHHQGLMLRPVFGDVLQAEARRQIEIELHGRELPRAANGIEELDVTLWSLKCGFAFHLPVWDGRP